MRFIDDQQTAPVSITRIDYFSHILFTHKFINFLIMLKVRTTQNTKGNNSQVSRMHRWCIFRGWIIFLYKSRVRSDFYHHHWFNLLAFIRAFSYIYASHIILLTKNEMLLIFFCVCCIQRVYLCWAHSLLLPSFLFCSVDFFHIYIFFRVVIMFCHIHSLCMLSKTLFLLHLCTVEAGAKKNTQKKVEE